MAKVRPTWGLTCPGGGRQVKPQVGLTLLCLALYKPTREVGLASIKRICFLGHS